MTVVGVILAAGAGRRYGAVKQLATLRERPLIEYALGAMLGVPALERIIIVLGAEAERIRAGAELDGAEIIIADDWRDGMSASLRAGIAAAPDADAVLVTLADQPLVTPEVLVAVLDRVDSRAPAARAVYAGRPGHPVLIKRELFGEVAQLRGDRGARDLLERSGCDAIECGHLASARDVDTPADLDAIARALPD